MVRISFGFSVLALTATVFAFGEAPAAPPVPTRGDAYVGAGRCASCHAEAFQVWQAKDPHAKAHLSLPPDRRNDLKCTGCHSPDPGGVFAGVQCESCHGSGRAYSFTFVMKDQGLSRVLGLTNAGEKRCLTCHIGHGDSKGGGAQKFDYRQKLGAIVHWSR